MPRVGIRSAMPGRGLAVDASARRVLWEAAWYSWAWNTAYAASGLLSAATTLLLPGALASASNALISTGRGFGHHGVSTWQVLALLGLDAAATALASLAKNASLARSNRQLRRLLSRRLIDAGPRAMDAHSAGDLVSRVGSAASGTAEYAYLMVNFAVGMLTSLGAMLALALLDWRLAVVFVTVVPVTAVITRRLSKQGRTTYRSYQDHLGGMAGMLSESLVGSRTIRANHTQEREAERVLSLLPELSRDGHASWGLMAASSWRLGLVGVIGQVAVLSVAIHAVAGGRLQAGDLLAVSGYATLATRFSSQLGPFASARAAAARVAEVLALPVLTQRSPGGDGGGSETVLEGLSVSELVVDHQGRRVLDRVSFHVPGGCSLAVVGASGAGKSVLGETIAGLWSPESGSITFNGTPLAVGETSYAFARPFLLGSSIGDALTYGRPGVGVDLVAQAARTVRIDHLIARLPHRYDTQLAQVGLSGGELQRLGLARSLLHDTPLIVIDDAMSSLDSATRAQVSDALGAPLLGRTRLIVTSSASTAAAADAVLWLENGRVRAFGDHLELSLCQGYLALLHNVSGSDAPVAAAERRELQ